LCFLFLPFIAFSAASLWSCEFPPAVLVAADAIIIVACHLCRLDGFERNLLLYLVICRHVLYLPSNAYGISAVAADYPLNSSPLLVKAQ
jgi:hypothetical protein